MDRVLKRNFFIFTLLTLLCFGGLGTMLIRGDDNIDRSGDWVIHTNSTLVASEQIFSLLQGMINNQRGWLITGRTQYLDAYQEKKSELSKRIADLSVLLADNPSQSSRLAEIRNYFTDLSIRLEARAKSVKPWANPDLQRGVEAIDALTENIERLHHELIDEEYRLFNARIHNVETTKDRYLVTLMVGGVVCVSVMLLLNGFLLHAQTKRNNAEKILKESEDRFAIAAEGANDGIFDWDIDTGKVFYSKAFYAMLGEDKPAHIGTLEDTRKLVHPEDVGRFQSHLDQYLRDELSEYSSTFRMRHVNGRWIWIHSRGKILTDENGRPHRMVGAHTDITYLKEQQERLEQAKLHAERANRAKTDFLAHMSHEIRTPLTAISGIAEILERQKNKFDEKQSYLIETLTSSTSTLKDLVNDILDFSKIESGELSIETKPFDPMEMFEQVISITALQALEKGVKFQLDYDDLKGVCLKGDPLRLRQILINLIGNAIKFTERGGSVEVNALRITRDDASELIKVDVKDTGIGIESANFDLIFERFKQGDSSVSRKYGGTGLGLPISRNLAHLMNGDIEVKSERGKGSTFTLTLPLILADDVQNDNEAAAPMGRVSRKTIDRLKSQAGEKGKILLVEDYEGNIVVISYFLEDLNLPYDVARTGKQAVDMWNENHYDLVLMDVQMPEMDGFTATRKIRESEKELNLPRTPIIGMTAHALVGDRDKCIEAGMDAYLAKPIVEADLRAKIATYLSLGKKAA